MAVSQPPNVRGALMVVVVVVGSSVVDGAAMLHVKLILYMS